MSPTIRWVRLLTQHKSPVIRRPAILLLMVTLGTFIVIGEAGLAAKDGATESVTELRNIVKGGW